LLQGRQFGAHVVGHPHRIAARLLANRGDNGWLAVQPAVRLLFFAAVSHLGHVGQPDSTHWPRDLQVRQVIHLLEVAWGAQQQVFLPSLHISARDADAFSDDRLDDLLRRQPPGLEGSRFQEHLDLAFLAADDAGIGHPLDPLQAGQDIIHHHLPNVFGCRTILSGYGDTQHRQLSGIKTHDARLADIVGQAAAQVGYLLAHVLSRLFRIPLQVEGYQYDRETLARLRLHIFHTRNCHHRVLNRPRYL